MNGRLQKKVGLALGGGVVRGLAHVGVITVLEEAGIEIECLAGTSAGAIIAVGYAAGMKAGQIKEFAQRLRWWHLVRLVWPRRDRLFELGRIAALEKLDSIKEEIGWKKEPLPAGFHPDIDARFSQQG